eukprot:445569-Rhodomonas_salina.2
MAAAAAQAAANTAKIAAAVGQQLLLIQQLQTQQQFLLDNADRNKLNLTFAARAALEDRAVAWVEGAMLAHHNYPADAPVILGDPTAMAAAQLEVEVQCDARPPLTFEEIKNKGLTKWMQLHTC